MTTKFPKNFISVAEANPALAAEWHPLRNVKSANEASSKTRVKAWWLCPMGHEWQSPIRNRLLNNVKCEICCNRKVLPGFNDLATVNPILASEWHVKKNILKVENVGVGNSSKAWWLCTKGHEWEAGIYSRHSKKVGCPVCSNKKILAGYNDLTTLMPKLAKEWHPTKNSKSPTEVTKGTNLKVWWICKKNHEWQANLSNRARLLQGCPYCCRQKVVAGEDDFATTHPELLVEWNYSRNAILPSDFGWGSEKKVWWICRNNHEWESPIRNRVIGKNCPYCTNRVILPGFNDLATLNPKLAKEWHPSKNTALPTEYGAGSAFKAWWICTKEHAWQSTIVNRHLLGRGCPKCCKRGTSQSETAFRKELAKYFSKINEDHTTRINLEGKDRQLQVDIVGEYKGVKVVVEYDGSYYHISPTRIAHDIANTKLLLDNGYIVVRIRESNLPFVDLKNKHLFQISHTFSLESKDISRTTKEILLWLDTQL